MIFQSTPSARRATASLSSHIAALFISIHALREEGDSRDGVIRARRKLFQSTPSARRATLDKKTIEKVLHISIHALREEGDCPLCIPASLPCDFNPRPPRGGRQEPDGGLTMDAVFQSTPSARRATVGILRVLHTSAISIHALREEGDSLCLTSSRSCGNFNPRPPRGGRRPAHAAWMAQCRFQSMPSARRATPGGLRLLFKISISIHALREEGDYAMLLQLPAATDFNPRPPRGGRHRGALRVIVANGFQSTPSARRATQQ